MAYSELIKNFEKVRAYGRDRACSAGGRRLRKSLEGGVSRKSGEKNKSLL